jgi:hypothetical protein
VGYETASHEHNFFGSIAMSGTLIFCTSYISDQEAWCNRYDRWIDHHKRVFPKDPLVIIDDGSRYLPNDPHIPVNLDIERFYLGSRASIFHFKHRLGRPAAHNFPGWFRSFTFSVSIAKRLGLEKIVHVESDCYILSARTLEFINETKSGWIAFWCPRWEFPETNFQIICEDSFPTLERIGKSVYETEFADKMIENFLPYTRVIRTLYGNRYGEFRRDVPRYADFAAQVDLRTKFKSDFDLCANPIPSLIREALVIPHKLWKDKKCL